MPDRVEVPSVRDIDKFPWAAVSKVQLGIIVLLISWIIFSKTGLVELERSELKKDNKDLQDKIFAQYQETLDSYRKDEMIKKELKLTQDSLVVIKSRVQDDLLPIARKRLKND